MKTKKKLIWQIFPSFIIITVLSLSAITSYSTSYFKKFFLINSEKELTIRAKLLRKTFSDILKNVPGQSHQIDIHCKNIGKIADNRVTVILPSGVVVGDSFADIKIMENHMKRPEISEALKKNKGVSIRYSVTLDKTMMYIALPVMDDTGVVAVVRTSVSVSAIDNEIKMIRNNILFALLITILVAALTSLYVSRRISRPVEEMQKGTVEFAKGNLNTRIAIPETEELSELAITMNQMAENLDEKIMDFKTRSMELEAIHSSMLEGVIAIDKNERIITINDAAVKIFGFSASQLKSRYILEIARHFELQKFIQKALKTHEPVEDDIVIAGDDELILNIHSTALYDSRNRRIGTLIIFHDITRIRRLETMHKEFAANVSHELKTPLTTIKGFVETLQQMMAANGIKESEAFLKIIEKNVNRMIDLINDLLALSKLERLQGGNIQLEEYSMNALIQTAVQNCSSNIKKKNMSVSIEYPEDITAMVDPSLMEQAIINLLDNAIKYSPEGKSITITVTKLGSYIEMRIQDNGNGIKKEHLTKIFNRFYRVDRGRSRNEGGTGLGLAIVKHIIQYHNGKIDVTSTKGSGSCFKISLPV
ncbi:MAG: PAS domain S-box protein [Desulfobacula sp.]|jgi:two-component system phosphate regulon sensor histidine kinase PhoR|uniref:sensor histidine kinase n=1 Tax=Desulfobacula sp. TaxID=2593537 RepID=UPI001DA7FE45|nr:PAS domain S-box protein [Desulfobacula sp.]MBT3485708.1 PAS domain S-box protein [Desulfobacula sp.]MBT3804862.1 PAS domain S-box protein [Desulfobacula sp.]MBT4026606.1 PAS domain S-box protein [Desulfobacula sp.]MBT4200439.1 PAS domain S-box protein [Desulfobacula sp.]